MGGEGTIVSVQIRMRAVDVVYVSGKFCNTRCKNVRSCFHLKSPNILYFCSSLFCVKFGFSLSLYFKFLSSLCFFVCEIEILSQT